MRVLVLALVASCFAPAAQAQSAWFDLPVPTASLSLIEVPADQRALVAQRAIRVLHSNPREGDPIPSVARFERLLTDLDTVETLVQRNGGRPLSLAMASNSSERDVLKDVVEAMGLRLRERRNVYAIESRRDDDAVALRKRLDSAGLDTAGLEKRLNDGETVAPAPAMTILPSPLPLDVWASVVFERPIPARSVFSAIIRDRKASLLFYGLQAMTPRTRAYVAGDRELLQRLYRDLAGPVAGFGSVLRLDEQGRMRLPGGAEASDLWEAVADERIERTDRFARAIFDRDSGRLAYFMDAIARLDVPRQRFALGLWMTDRGIRLDRFRALYRTFVDVEPKWSPAVRPFARPLYDPATLMGIVATGPNGDPAVPAFRRLWERAFDGVDLPDAGSNALGNVAEDGVVDAAWLAEHSISGVFLERRAITERLAFGQRVFGTVQAREMEDVLVSLRGFGRYPALMQTLERMGVRRPGLYALIARHARQIEGVSDATLAVPLLAQFQGALALLDRMSRTGAVPTAKIDELVASLGALRVTGGRYDGALATWIDTQFVPGLPAATGEGSARAETVLLHALAERASRVEPFSWEGDGYIVDLGSASVGDLVAIRAKQGGNSLDAVLAVHRDIAALRRDGLTIETLKPLVASLKSSGARLAPARPWPDDADDVPNVKKVLDRALQSLGKITKPKDVSKASRLVEPVVEVTDYLLGETMAALAYAPWLGDPAELLGPEADLSHRHRFGFVTRPGMPPAERISWQRPRADAAGDAGFGYLGSLLGMDLALAKKRLRRLSADGVPVAPRLSPNDADTFVQTLALLNPRALTSEDLASIGRALARGRERVRAAMVDATSIDELADRAQMGEARRQLMTWVISQKGERGEDLFSMTELFDLGRGDDRFERLDDWGSSAEPLLGCFCVRYPSVGAWERLGGRPGVGQLGGAVPDLTLRVAEHMADLKVPAALLPSVLAMATQAFIDSAPPLYDDDWLGVVGHAQDVSRESVEDYVAALVAAGPVTTAPSSEATK